MRHLRNWRLLLFSILLSACDDIQQVSNSKHGAYEASMAVLPNGFAVAWYDDRSGNPEIYFRILDSEGKPAGPEHRITNDPGFSYEADIAAAGDGNLAVAWYERLADGNLRAKIGMWTEDGRERWTKLVSTTGRGTRNILVRAIGNELFCAWIEDTGGETAEVWGGWWSLSGDSITTPRRLAAASRTTWNLNAAIDPRGRAWIVLDAKAEGTKTNELFLVSADRSTQETLRLTADDGFASKYPDLAFTKDRLALTWFDERDGNQEVYLFAAPANDVPSNVETRSRRITNTPAESIGAYVAWQGDRIGLAWCDKSAGQQEIYFQSFDTGGGPLHEARRLTHTRTDSLIPAIKPWRDGFALVWNEYESRGQGHSGGRSEILFAFAR